MSNTISRRGGRTAAAIIASALCLSALAISPAHAGSAVFSVGSGSATIDDVIVTGSSIHIEGSGWSGKDAQTGQCIGVKLGNGSGSAGTSGALGTKQSTPPTPAGSCTGQTAAAVGAWALIEGEADGTFEADLAFPSATNSTPAIEASEWAAGTAHHLRLLGGSLNGGDTRSAYLDFTVGAAATTPTLNNSTVAFGSNAALTGSGFEAGTDLTASIDGTALSFVVRGVTPNPTTWTVPATGLVSGVSLALPTTLRRGEHTVTLHADDGSAQGFDRTITVTVTPALTWSANPKPGSTGTVTIKGLATGAVIESITDGTATIAQGFAAADAAGTTSATYTIPAAAEPGYRPWTFVQSSPAETFQYSSTIYPTETVANDGRFAISSNADQPALFQGLYQSAFSDRQDALFAAASSGTGVNEDGYLYKLDPDTLAVEASVHPKELTDATVDKTAGMAPYGVGVDDVNGTVWVSNTRTNAVAVYDADDLTLLKQFPTGTLSHSRDVVYDPKTNHVFISSASEGTSGYGSIGVFEAGDNDKDGVPYEFVKAIKTGARADFNPISLSLGNGVLTSPSLSTNKVVMIDTAAAVKSAVPADGGVDSAVKVISIAQHIPAGNGRGASGIAYDAEDQRIFVASQNANSVYIYDVKTETVKIVATGQGALNVAYDKNRGLVYVTNFGGTTITVLDVEGNIVANLPIQRANHVTVTGDGTVYAVDKFSSPNKAWKISPRLETLNGTTLTNPAASSTTGSAEATPLTVSAPVAGKIQLSGTNFVTKDRSAGSKLGIKTDLASDEYVAVDADATGAWSASIDVPTTWTPGGSYVVRVLSGKFLTGDEVRSIAIKVTVTAGALTTATPVITGSAHLGKTLTAKPGTWTTGTAFTYQWKRNGVAIKGATKASYAVTTADSGKTLTVSVTGTKAHYKAATVTSKALKVTFSTAEKKVVAAEAKVAKTKATISSLSAQIKATKATKKLSTKAKAKKVKALNKKLTSAKKQLKKDTNALTKAKKSLK